MITFGFIEGRRWTDMVTDQIADEKTITDWFSFCRDICDFVVKQDNSKIGGDHEVVELDETHLTSNKYNRGRQTAQQRAKKYVFGGVCRSTKDFFMIYVKNTQKATLYPIILE